MGDEESLWSFLDAHGLKFRDPLAVLIDRFGTAPEAWSMGVQELHLPAAHPLFGGLIPGFAVIVTDRSDPEACPSQLTARYRAGEWAPTFRKVCTAITAEFGPGKDVSVSNTRATEWAFGRARLRATVWPPEVNGSMTNARHALDPGAAEECSLSLHPRWFPPLTDQTLEVLRSYVPQPLVPKFHPLQQDLLRDWPAGAGPLRPGVGLTLDGEMLVAAEAGGLCLILPHRRFLAVDHIGKTPARGSGGATMSLSWQHKGGAHTVRIAEAFGDHTALLTEAAALAEALNLPLRAEVWPDD